MSLFQTAQKIDFFVPCSFTDKCINILGMLPEDITYLLLLQYLRRNIRELQQRRRRRQRERQKSDGLD